MGVEHCAVFSYGIEISRKVEAKLLRNYLEHLGRGEEWPEYENGEYLYDLCELINEHINEQCGSQLPQLPRLRYVCEAYERDVDSYLFFDDLGINAGEKWSGCTSFDESFIGPNDCIEMGPTQAHMDTQREFFIGTKFVSETADTIPAEVESWKSWCTKVETQKGFDEAVAEMMEGIPGKFSWNLYRYMA